MGGINTGVLRVFRVMLVLGFFGGRGRVLPSLYMILGRGERVMGCWGGYLGR